LTKHSNGKEINTKDKGFIIILMGKNTKVSGKMVIKMEKEHIARFFKA